MSFIYYLFSGFYGKSLYNILHINMVGIFFNKKRHTTNLYKIVYILTSILCSGLKKGFKGQFY